MNELCNVSIELLIIVNFVDYKYIAIINCIISN